MKNLTIKTKVIKETINKSRVDDLIRTILYLVYYSEDMCLTVTEG